MSKTSSAGLVEPNESKSKRVIRRPSLKGRVPRKPKGETKSREQQKAERDAEELAAKVVTLWIAGRTIFEMATELGVSESTVRRIKDSCPDEILSYVEQAKSEKISILIERGLEEQLLAMIRITEVTKDEIWVKGQRAPELATFFGVISDKTVRVLAAMERAAERRSMVGSVGGREEPEASQEKPAHQVIRAS